MSIFGEIFNMHSLTEENYLKAIYYLSSKGEGKITPTSIADSLGVNAASVIDMIKKLSDKKFIQYNKQDGVKFEKSGAKLALEIVRNHRLWEVFLVDKLGYSWDVVHEIAEQLEHIKHPELANRLDSFLGHPEYDPHGDPIPKSNGELPKTTTTLLADIKEGKSCKVVAIKDTSTLFLQYLLKLNIHIGTNIQIIEKIPYDSSIQISINGASTTAVSSKFADSILVI